MKKIFLLVAMACVASLSAIAETVGQAMLIHGDNVTMFNSDKIQNAIEQAEDGDVIQLTEGTFAPFTLTKAVHIKGAGQGSVISSNVSIEIPNKPVLDHALITGVYINGSLTLNSEMTNVMISKCFMKSFTCYATNTEIVVDKCDIEAFHYNQYFGTCNVVNTWVGDVYSSGEIQEVANFVNCWVTTIHNNPEGYTSGTYINSMIYHTDYPKNTAFLYCLCYGGTYLGDNSSNLYGYVWDVHISGFIWNLSPESLTERGYIGNDGTVVGVFGGNNPFTLVVTGPKVTENEIKVDAANKKLNVTLQVTAN